MTRPGQIKTLTAVTLFFLLLALLATFPLVLGMTTHIYGPFYGTDMRGAVWHLWWYKQAIHQGLDFASCPYVAAPFGADLSREPVSWAALWLLFALLAPLSPLACLNLLTLLTLTMTGLVSFLLVKRLTGHTAAALIAATAFTFAPYHLNKLAEFSFFFLGNWFVLFVLSLMFYHQNKNRWTLLLAGLSLGVTAAFSPYYGFLGVVGLAVYGVFDALYAWRLRVRQDPRDAGVRRLFKDALRSMAPLAVVAAVALLFNAPVAVNVIKALFAAGQGPGPAADIPYVRSLKYLFAQSARPLSYLLPAATHPVFGRFTQRMFGSFLYGRGAIEQTLYVGWIPLFLAWSAYGEWKKRRRQGLERTNGLLVREDYAIGLFLALTATAFFVSLPPYIDLLIFKIYLPSYFLHKLLPMFRAYARFGMVVMLGVSVLAGFGIKFLLERLRTRNAKGTLATLLFIGILFEFTNIPPWRATDISRTPEVYRWLALQPADVIVAEYPMTLANSGEAQFEYDYQFYQTRHGRRLVNGAYPGTKAFEVKKAVRRVDDPRTPHLLKALGTDYIIVHTDEYTRGYRDDVAVAGTVPQVDRMDGYRFLRRFGAAEIYEVIAPQAPAGAPPAGAAALPTGGEA